MHYFVKKAYQEVLVSPVIEEDSIKIYVVSDRLKNTPAELVLTLMDFEGKKQVEKRINIQIPANKSQVFYREMLSNLLGNLDKKNLVLVVKLQEDDKQIAENYHYFLAPKELNLTETKIQYNIKKEEEGYRVELWSEKLAKNVFLSVNKGEGFFSDNYFDLLPKEKKIVWFYTEKDIDLAEKITLKSLVDTYEPKSKIR